MWTQLDSNIFFVNDLEETSLKQWSVNLQEFSKRDLSTLNSLFLFAHGMFVLEFCNFAWQNYIYGCNILNLW